MAAPKRIVGEINSTPHIFCPSRKIRVTQGSGAGMEKTMTITHYVRIRSHLDAARKPAAVWNGGLLAKVIPAIGKLTGIMAATISVVGDRTPTPTSRKSGVTQGSGAGMAKTLTITNYVRISS
jgi:hypothetical protein